MLQVSKGLLRSLGLSEDLLQLLCKFNGSRNFDLSADDATGTLFIMQTHSKLINILHKIAIVRRVDEARCLQ